MFLNSRSEATTKKHCKNPYIREGDFINQLIQLIDKMDMNETGIMRKFEDEVARYRKFQKGVLGAKNEYMIGNNEVDIKNYAKYLLAEGNATEKREILACLKSKLVFKDKMVQLVK